jgi:type III secretion system TyeA family effector delivery regulator
VSRTLIEKCQTFERHLRGMQQATGTALVLPDLQQVLLRLVELAPLPWVSDANILSFADDMGMADMPRKNQFLQGVRAIFAAMPESLFGSADQRDKIMEAVTFSIDQANQEELDAKGEAHGMD